MKTLLGNRPDLSPLDKADPEALYQAVAIVQARYEATGLQPGNERWQSDTRIYRAKMVEDVRLEWVRIAATDVIMPWHDDYVAQVWVAFRKLRLEQRKAAWENFGIDVPDRILEKIERTGSE